MSCFCDASGFHGMGFPCRSSLRLYHTTYTSSKGPSTPHVQRPFLPDLCPPGKHLRALPVIPSSVLLFLVRAVGNTRNARKVHPRYCSPDHTSLDHPGLNPGFTPFRYRLPLGLRPKRRVPKGFPPYKGRSMPRRAPPGLRFFLMDHHINQFSYVRGRSRETKSSFFLQLSKNERLLFTITQK